MAKIPGLSFIPPDDESGEVIEIPSFSGTIIKVPESHRYGSCRLRDEFEKLGTIYEGNFGTVYKCRDKEKKDQIYALKKFSISPDMLRNGMPASFLREISVLKVLKHHNIVNAHAIVAGKKLDSNFLLLDYCVTSLHELIERKCDSIYEIDVVKYIMKQLFDGLSYIHESQIVHRNISCRNLLFNESGNLKISGFRTARFYDKENMTPAVTELTYRAPELLFKSKYGLPADIWSAGCVFAYLLLKKPLFTGDSELAVLKSMFSILGTPSEAIWPGFNDILQKGSDDQKELSTSQPYTDIKNVLTGTAELSSQLLNTLIVWYPPARLKASEMMTTPYMLESPPECSPEKMKAILEKACSVSELLDVPMQVDS